MIPKIFYDIPRNSVDPATIHPREARAAMAVRSGGARRGGKAGFMGRLCVLGRAAMYAGARWLHESVDMPGSSNVGLRGHIVRGATHMDHRCACWYGRRA